MKGNRNTLAGGGWWLWLRIDRVGIGAWSRWIDLYIFISVAIALLARSALFERWRDASGDQSAFALAVPYQRFLQPPRAYNEPQGDSGCSSGDVGSMNYQKHERMRKKDGEKRKRVLGGFQKIRLAVCNDESNLWWSSSTNANVALIQWRISSFTSGIRLNIPLIQILYVEGKSLAKNYLIYFVCIEITLLLFSVTILHFFVIFFVSLKQSSFRLSCKSWIIADVSDFRNI